MRIFVGNLAWSVDNQTLESIFAPFGEVASATVLMDRDTGRSKGFGFVEMPDETEARRAIASLSGSQHGGRPLTVNEARPREERSGGGGGGGYGGGRGGGGGGGGGGGYGGGRGRY
ncbi:MAG: RNA-binding protein [SAR202 cluster bacterium]|nr:RNA-binding protein [SAR202 cluster bacterium]